VGQGGRADAVAAIDHARHGGGSDASFFGNLAKCWVRCFRHFVGGSGQGLFHVTSLFRAGGIVKFVWPMNLHFRDRRGLARIECAASIVIYLLK